MITSKWYFCEPVHSVETALRFLDSEVRECSRESEFRTFELWNFSIAFCIYADVEMTVLCNSQDMPRTLAQLKMLVEEHAEKLSVSIQLELQRFETLPRMAIFSVALKKLMICFVMSTLE